tara:strand:+ start:991 stop:2004 length:1014 start_codon:yes stop_codon:yes gene_type:complete
MKLSDFHYDLPQELIAQRPAERRDASRMLVLGRDSGAIAHKCFTDLPDYLEAGDLLVFNNSKVIPARLYGTKATGGKVEILVERLLDEHRVLAHVGASKSPKAGMMIALEQGEQVETLGRDGDLFELCFASRAIDVLEQQGHMPLPPYIERSDDAADQDRYQTVYADPKGSVAAPTAGLHYDDAMLQRLKDKGVETAFVTLHVGAGTFQPVRTDNIEDHHMHSEYVEVSQAVCDKVKAVKANGKRVFAAGTTSVRCLETASQGDEIKPYFGDTDIFIYPGYQFRCVDGLQTNFHLPESTLVMLVSALAGYESTMQAYAEAVAEQYRFFSYGDTMLIV